MLLPRLLALVSILLVCSQANALVDLTKIERKIGKEPIYRGKPKYCLLVLGPEAKKRVWLVQDGDTLYVDRNGNGDLTEPGEKVAAQKRKRQDADPLFTFLAGELRQGGRRHLNLSLFVQELNGGKFATPEARAVLQRDARARQYNIQVEVERPGYQGLGTGGRLQQGAGLDTNGLLQFADRPQDAPIVHFDGTWTIHLYQETTLWLGRTNKLSLMFGTPGLGAGSFAYVGYEGVVPENVSPRVEIAFPPRKPGGPPVIARYDLKERC
jgi:hypothetical protein